MPEDQPHLKAAPGAESLQKIEGVNVIGYLTGEMGLGEVARQYTAALQAVGVPVATKTFTHFGNRSGHEFAELTSTKDYPVNLICLQPLELIQLYREVGEDFFKGRRSIGVWGWELNTFPEKWLNALELLDEVWVWTDYVADTLSRVSSRPVSTIPIPVTAPDPGDATVDLGVPEGFTFIFVFDFHSVVKRKNPLGLVEAFKRAFAPGEGPQLVVKSINGDAHPERFAELQAAAQVHPDVHVVDRYLSGREKNALMAGCDCYVSLHRSEGFGLTPAEAMALGKPVIATGFSGNTDFMTDENSYLVDYTMTEVGPGSPPYPPEGLWADPDLDHAARLMRRVWENQDEARARGERARRDVARNLSHEAVGERMRVGLERVIASPPLSQESGRIRFMSINANHGQKLQTIREMIEHGPHVEGSSRFGRAGRIARQIMLRTIQPFTFYQGKVDEELVNALQRTARSIGVLKHQLRRQQEERGVELGELEARVSQRLDGLETEVSQRLDGLKREVSQKADRIEEHLGALERDATEEMRRLSAELSGVLSGLRTKPDPGHAVPSYTDESGRVVLGFRDAKDGPDGGEAYRALEGIFRGDEQTVRYRQASYTDLVADRSWVLNVGCGRGEFLDLLRDRGIKVKGVDGNEALVNYCRDKGHDVALSEVNAHLREQDDASIPAIFASRSAVEHLSYDELLEFLRLASEKTEAEGLLIFEAVNYHSLEALKTFWLDPKNQHPIFPEVALTMCRLAGFGSGRVVFPNGSQNPERELFSSRDYAVLATKAASEPITERGKARLSAQERNLSTDEVHAAVAGVENWFHRIEVAPGIVTPGVSDSAATLAAMELPERLDGQRILDVGARDGYFSFAAEARGAEVLAIESVAPHLTGFETAASLLGSSVDYRTANVYDLRPERVGMFDGIFFLGVLYHLRDPMLALDRLSAVAKPGATIWVESQVIDRFLVDPATRERRDFSKTAPELVDVPLAQFYSKNQLGENHTNWWAPNLVGLRAMIESAGFKVARAQLLGGRGMVVGSRVEDDETEFFRDFDRSYMTADEGMAWEHMKEITKSRNRTR